MNHKLNSRLVLVATWLMVCPWAFSAQTYSQESISFNRDIRPILTKACFACHGPDENHRQADLRLDDRDVAVDLEAIVPGKPDESTLVERIFSEDEDSVMPPPEADHRLTEAQKQILRTWVAEGAKFDTHWAFQQPVLPSVPIVDSDWPANAIDHFVFQKLASHEIKPAQEADRYSLVRRVYLDLIGLPPTIEQADAFVNSQNPDAYAALVDQLLASPRYGERWAQPWLDLARYSDTNGYEKDRERSIWPYRDWVIKALNSDLPYDQFTIEQIAGDMLENPTPQQMIATGFHRNTMLNEEGGIDPLEYRFLAMVDRVATTGTVWLGLTTGCAQCHTHKYDPISHTDYYQLMALMNNADEPDYRIPEESRVAEIARAMSEVQRLEEELATKFRPDDDGGLLEIDKTENPQQVWSNWFRQGLESAVDWNIIRPTSMHTNLPRLEVLKDGSVFSTGDTTKRDEFELTFDLDVDEDGIGAIRLEAIPDPRLPDGGPGRTYYEGRKGDFFVSEVFASLDGQKLNFKSASHDFSSDTEQTPKQRADNVFDGDGSTGWQPGQNKSMRLKLVMNLANPIMKSGQLKIKLLFERHYTVSLGRFRFSTASDPNAKANRLDEDVEQLLTILKRTAAGVEEESLPNDNVDLNGLSPSNLERLHRAFLLSTPELATARKKMDAAKAKIPKLNETMVMNERPVDNPRVTNRHHRGEFLSPKEEVTPGIPALFEKMANEELPGNRLEFARWLVSDANPLVARVAVDRAWREIFGAGLVRTNGDFGVQSEPPTHPELLDWLAVELKDEMNWSTKKLHRLIVMSKTYRQTSLVSPAMLHRDPENRLLARGPSFRVPGELVRDIALQSTGSISDVMFGPGVRPPQPASVTSLAYGATKWIPSTGADRFRRSIYTFKKRTAGFAAYSVFDSPSGETCTARRNRSNTPLQALTVLNDEMYLELARNLARTTVEKKLETAEANVNWIFRSFLTRPPTKTEITSLMNYYGRQVERLEKGELDPSKVGGDGATVQQAALAMVARVVMNLDETITKR